MRIFVGLLGAILLMAPLWAAHGNPVSAKVDSVFASWNNERSPGCAVAIVRDGVIFHGCGYGMADVRNGVANGPDLVFDVGSVAKQFTAMSVLLLERDGKLSLEDDIRLYLPELSDFGETVTVSHLIFHTSGIPEYGIDDEEIVTNAAAMAQIRTFRTLRFKPGARYEYSNAGYVLLARIVERISGKTLGQFARERIFGPLGMSNTWFGDETRERISGAARGYDGTMREGYFLQERANAIVGDGNLRTSISDLAKWAGNFSENRLGGGASLIDSFTAPGSSSENDGTLDYAFGLHVDRYGGLQRFVHEGTWYGFRAAFLHFPKERLTVIVLANLESIDSLDLAERVADLVLADEMREASLELGES